MVPSYSAPADVIDEQTHELQVTTPLQEETSHHIADLQSVMQMIDVLLEEVSCQHRALIPNALLNLAVERMLAEQAPKSAAAILYRLAELIVDGQRPKGSNAFPLTGNDA
jgi:hypothetical protein